MDELRHTAEDGASGPMAHESGTAELAECRLRRSAYPALRHISCAFGAGVLTLRGRLPSYYLKQVAQAVVAAIGEVMRIDNQIAVVPAASLSHASRGRPRALRP